jgi:tetratricopeptide (TPR) repeat protein
MELEEAPCLSDPDISAPAPAAAALVKEPQRGAIDARVRSLVVGMAIVMVAGTAVFLIDYGRALRDLTNASWSVRSNPGVIFLYVEPVELLRVGWPLLFVSAFCLLRWPRLALAAALTFLALATDRFLAMVIAFETARHPVGTRLLPSPTGPNGFLTRSLVTALIIAFVFMLFYALFGVRAFLLDLRYRKLTPANLQAADRNRWLIGRLAVMGSIVFMIFLFGARLWTVYDDVLLAMPAFRSMVLRSDPALLNGSGNSRVPNDPKVAGLQSALGKGIAAQNAKRYDEVQILYPEITESLAKFPKTNSAGRYYRLDTALMANNLAWSLATTADLAGRDPEKAVELAKKAVEFVPDDGNSWNTLAVAYYRARAWKEARATFKKAMDLRDGGDSFDWFFLAMIAATDGQPDEARQWYDKAVVWMKANRPADAELRRFRIEAVGVLKIDDSDAATPLPDRPLRRRRTSRMLSPE